MKVQPVAELPPVCMCADPVTRNRFGVDIDPVHNLDVVHIVPCIIMPNYVGEGLALWWIFNGSQKLKTDMACQLNIWPGPLI